MAPKVTNNKIRKQKGIKYKTDKIVFSILHKIENNTKPRNKIRQYKNQKIAKKNDISKKKTLKSSYHRLQKSFF